MLYVVSIGAVLVAWALLRIMGDELQRRRSALRVMIEAERLAAAEHKA